MYFLVTSPCLFLLEVIGMHTIVYLLFCLTTFRFLILFLFHHLYLPETALKLDTMVGDIEDAVSSTMKKNLKKHYSAQNSEVRTVYFVKNKVVFNL